MPNRLPPGGDGRSSSDRHLRKRRLTADLMLLAAALAWGSTFVPCKIAAASLDLFLFNGLRFLVGAVLVLTITGRRIRSLSRREIGGGILVGLVLFAAAAFQQAGLSFTTAGKAGFITGLYVVLVPFLLTVVWRQWPGWAAWGASVLAAVGLFLLSAEGRLVLAPGDSLVLLGAALYALHVILIGQMVRWADPLRLATVQFLACGLTNLPLGLTVGRASLIQLPSAWWAIVYTAVFSIGVGYTFQTIAQRHAPPTDAAVILSLEAVFAAVFGWLLLGEYLTFIQLVGCGLMLSGMLLAQLGVRPAPSPRPSSPPACTKSPGQRTPA